MDQIIEFVKKQIPSYSNPSSTERYRKYLNFMKKFLPSEEVFPVNYKFNTVPGDGNCTIHAMLRFFGYMGWEDLPNLDITNPEYSAKDMDTYTTLLKTLMELTRDYCREHLSDPTYEHNEGCPEYELIFSWFAQEKCLRVIVLEIDVYNPDNYNSVREYKPTTGHHFETIILLNSVHHFYLISPTSTNPHLDTKTIREIVGNYIIEKLL